MPPVSRKNGSRSPEARSNGTLASRRSLSNDESHASLPVGLYLEGCASVSTDTTEHGHESPVADRLLPEGSRSHHSLAFRHHNRLPGVNVRQAIHSAARPANLHCVGFAQLSQAE